MSGMCWDEGMAATSARALEILSVMSSGRIVSSAALASRLGVGERTIRRDFETLRDLGYDVEPIRGVGGGYRLRGGSRILPMVFDEDQVVAIALALQTAPTVLAGIAESNSRALATIRQFMPERLRIESDAFTVTSVPNYWEFPAAPIDAQIVRDVGAAVRQRHVLRVDYRKSDGEMVRMRVEPHDMIVWAARWYLVAFDLGNNEWRALRLERLHAKEPTFVPFQKRPLPAASATDFVKRTFDRGDSIAGWPCQGSAVLAVPPGIVAEFAPGGAVVEHVSSTSSRLTMGAWSWIGLAGLFITFAADMTDVEPAQLRKAFVTVQLRLARLPGRGDDRRTLGDRYRSKD